MGRDVELAIERAQLAASRLENAWENRRAAPQELNDAVGEFNEAGAFLAAARSAELGQDPETRLEPASTPVIDPRLRP